MAELREIRKRHEFVRQYHLTNSRCHADRAALLELVDALDAGIRNLSCPSPWPGDDGSAGACHAAGHCGCENGALIETLEG